MVREQDEKAEKDKEAKEQKALEKAEKDSKVSRPRQLKPAQRERERENVEG